MSPLYQKFASALSGFINSQKNNNQLWIIKHEESIDDLLKEHMPSGSGFNSGTCLEYEKSTPEKLVFGTYFHHMDENGYYTKTTYHEIVVTPSLLYGFSLKITGKNYNDIKEYIGDIFNQSLLKEID